MSQTQLQELESAIRQKSQYLETQDNQIVRNRQLLQSQNSQLNQAKADLKAVKQAIVSFSQQKSTKLEELRQQAEQTPSERFVNLTQKNQALAQEISKLKKTKQNVVKSIDDSEEHLSLLDADIIEADAIHKELYDQITRTKQKLRDWEHKATFQSAVVMALQKDCENLEGRIEVGREERLDLLKSHQHLSDEIDNFNQKLKSVEADIYSKHSRLTDVNSQLSQAEKSLKKTLDNDKHFRKGLAEEKLRLASERQNLESSKEAVKKAVLANEQIYPKFKLGVKPDEPKHYKL